LDGRDIALSGAGSVTIDEQAAVLSGEKAGDPQFLHAVLCQLGLPRSPTPNRTFERTSGRASLRLQAGATYNGKKWVDQPLPSGTRPRLVLIELCSEAVRTQNPEVDIGSSVREFLRRLGIDAGGESMGQFRKQMLALSACHMTLAMPTPKGAAQIDAKPIDAFQAWHTDENGQQALWPGHMRLTQKFFESLVDHAVPLDCEAIGQLQNSALALDVYSWLAHRLWRVREKNGVELSWLALQAQFGQEYRDRKNFKREFTGALQKAVNAYKDARIEAVPGGLKLLPSPPPVKRLTTTVPGLPPPTAGQEPMPVAAPMVCDEAPMQGARDERARRRIFVSPEALEAGRKLAPGWDKHWLEAKFLDWANALGEPLRVSPDKAFLGWVKSFTRGKKSA
jgi:hypothetical protein